MKQRKRKKFLSFRQLKKAVRALGISCQAEFPTRFKEIPGAPSNPNVIYWNKGWKGQPDLFGRPRTGKHGESRGGKPTPELRSWQNMIARCFCEKSPSYEYYGARGVTVCARWLDYKNFLADLGRKPSKQHSIGRAGDVGNYEPGNARWMSREEQSAERVKKYATQHYISKRHSTPQLPIAA
jgi:hypothetical protein